MTTLTRISMTADELVKTLKPRIVAVPWFTPAGWSRLLELAADPANLPETFEQFEQLATARIAVLEERGMAVERVMVDPDALAKWCSDLGVPCDSAARSGFALIRAMERDELGGRA